MGGVTIFEPGESSSMHVHDESEEISIVLGGRGTLVSEGEEREFGTDEWMWIPQGHLPSAQEHGQRAASVGVDLHAAGRPPVVLTDARLRGRLDDAQLASTQSGRPEANVNGAEAA